LLGEIGVLEEIKKYAETVTKARIFAPNSTSVSVPVYTRDNLADYMLCIPRIELDNILLRHACEQDIEYQDNIKVTLGESAGLVNPLTGEGIDYAIESGKIATENVQKWVQSSQVTKSQGNEYDNSLRQHFQGIFGFSWKDVSVAKNRLLLNTIVYGAAKSSEMKKSLSNAVLRGSAPTTRLTAMNIMKKIALALLKQP
jgi:2-polyprenyl-6-methoxyphenol hydroxylase-like FAD-dependent oxidoreductase